MSAPGQIVVATLDTAHLMFTALGTTTEEARDALADAWDAHRAQAGAVLTFDDLVGDIRYLAGAPGTAYRDGTQII